MLCYKKQNHTHTSSCNGNASRERKAHTKHVPTFLLVYTFKRRKMQSYTTNLKFPLEENIFNIWFHCHCRCLFLLQFICHLVVYLCVSLSQRGYGGSRAFSLKCDPRWCDCPGLPVLCSVSSWRLLHSSRAVNGSAGCDSRVHPLIHAPRRPRASFWAASLLLVWRPRSRVSHDAR